MESACANRNHVKLQVFKLDTSETIRSGGRGYDHGGGVDGNYEQVQGHQAVHDQSYGV